MQAGFKGKAKGVGEGPDQEAHDAPVMPPKVGGFTLGFAVLMQGDDSGHPPGIFHHRGVIAQQDGAPCYHDRDLLVHHQAAPVRHHGIETPGAGVEKVY
jgi:hypothetical protein